MLKLLRIDEAKAVILSAYVVYTFKVHEVETKIPESSRGAALIACKLCVMRVARHYKTCHFLLKSQGGLDVCAFS